jgi:hypothetical protein
MAGELDLDAVTHGVPAVRINELGGELLQFCLRCPDDVASTGLAQPGQICRAGHSAVADPDATERAMPGLHGGDDRLQCP